MINNLKNIITHDNIDLTMIFLIKFIIVNEIKVER